MRLLALIICLFFSTPSFSQNAFFIPFGQTQNEVLSLIHQKEYLFELQQSQDSIAQRLSSDQEVAYYFKEGTLFAIQDTRVYHDKKEADRIIKTITDYMDTEDRNIHSIQNNGDTDHMVAISADRIIELKTIVKTIKKNNGKGKKKDKHKEVTLFLKVTSRMHGPKAATEHFVASIMQKD